MGSKTEKLVPHIPDSMRGMEVDVKRQKNWDRVANGRKAHMLREV